MVKKVEDLTGKTFGGITVLNQEETKHYPSGGQSTMWKVQCNTCGKTFVIDHAGIKRNKYGCKDCALGVVDITGKKIGKLTVLEKTDYQDENKQTSGYWKCLCECGNICIKPYYKLTDNERNVNISCGKCNQLYENLSEQRFGKLIAKTSVKKGNKVYWECICDCGNTCVIQAWDLKNKRRHCGKCEKVTHPNRQQKDITGQTFGYLTAIKKIDDNTSEAEDNKYKWLFQCKCGNQKIITKHQVTSGRVKSCGCLAIEVNKKENIYDLSGNYGIGWTWNGDEFYFDLEDYDLIKDYCWRLDSRGYVIAEIEHHIYTMAQLIMCPPPDMYVTYKNKTNKLDNRRCNLEIVESIIPSKEYFQSKSKTGCVGVTERKGRKKKWRASIRVDGNAIDLGSYYTFEEAVEARKEGEKIYGR